MKHKTTWILIADGARARVLSHTGTGKGLDEVEGFEFAAERLRTQDIMADKPGRSFSSAGSKRSAMQPQTDPVDKREADFVRELAEMLDKQLRKNAFDRLIIAAAPKALGDIRKSLSPQVQTKILAELSKNLTSIPNDDIEKHFEDVLAV